MKKRAIIFYWICISIFILAPFAQADEQPISLMVNEEYIQAPQQPVLIEGRTLIPIRTVSEHLNCTVTWYPSDQAVYIETEHSSFSLFIGKPYIESGEMRKEIDVAPQLIEGTTMVPVRVVAEMLGCNVEWLDSTRCVYINSPNAYQYYKNYSLTKEDMEWHMSKVYQTEDGLHLFSMAAEDEETSCFLLDKDNLVLDYLYQIDDSHLPYYFSCSNYTGDFEARFYPEKMEVDIIDRQERPDRSNYSGHYVLRPEVDKSNIPESALLFVQEFGNVRNTATMEQKPDGSVEFLFNQTDFYRSHHYEKRKDDEDYFGDSILYQYTCEGDDSIVIKYRPENPYGDPCIQVIGGLESKYNGYYYIQEK